MPEVKTRMISTSAWAKQLGIPAKELFYRLQEQGWIVKGAESWELTPDGRSQGGDYRNHPTYGQFIGWPDSLVLPNGAATGPVSNSTETAASSGEGKLITATQLGKLCGLSANRLNSVLSELGWIEKHIKGWTLTNAGNRNGGQQREDFRSGVPYVVWPEAIQHSKAFRSSLEEVQGASSQPSASVETETTGFRDKFEAKHRAADGHYVRSKAEMLIDNWLYMAEIVHAYERKLPVEEEVYCDFYIPTGKVYIEYWGYENDERYLARKKVKQEIYKKYGFKLIELDDKDVQNLDDVLPKLLLKHGVQSY